MRIEGKKEIYQILIKIIKVILKNMFFCSKHCTVIRKNILKWLKCKFVSRFSAPPTHTHTHTQRKYPKGVCAHNQHYWSTFCILHMPSNKICRNSTCFLVVTIGSSLWLIQEYLENEWKMLTLLLLCLKLVQFKVSRVLESVRFYILWHICSRQEQVKPAETAITE
jgi:hypothetical protein